MGWFNKDEVSLLKEKLAAATQIIESLANNYTYVTAKEFKNTTASKLSVKAIGKAATATAREEKVMLGMEPREYKGTYIAVNTYPVWILVKATK